MCMQAGLMLVDAGWPPAPNLRAASEHIAPYDDHRLVSDHARLHDIAGPLTSASWVVRTPQVDAVLQTAGLSLDASSSAALAASPVPAL